MARSRKPSHSSDDDGDIVMVESDEAPKKTRPRRSQKKVIDSDDDDDDVQVVEPEPPKVSESSDKPKRTRMLMVAVEVPKPKVQTTISSFFGGSSTPPKPLASTKKTPAKKILKNLSLSSYVKAESSATKATSAIFTSARKSKKIESDPEDDDFVPEEVPSEPEDEPEPELSEVEEVEEEAYGSESDAGSKPKKGKGKAKAVAVTATGKVKKESYKCIQKPCGFKVDPREGDLPPMSSLDLIFDDIISRVPLVKTFMGPKKYRKLRVATMCSGTESPLLALNMFAKAIKSRGLGRLEIDHVFSCEIEPYKQAYIERNFKPPILFRDIKELGRAQATTAYGALVDVPGNIDILIAGTSCVDFSNLNNKQKSLEEGGESGDTFLGMMAWVKNHQPQIVIQENVMGAAWAEMRRYYHGCNYAAEYHYLDSKYYYIPHTRTRGYIMATPGKESDIPNKWIHAVKILKRPATTTFESFMLPDDDPRVYKARVELAGDERSGPVKARVVDWDKCEGRHQRERINLKLGMKRPCTAWEEGGVCRLLDFMWQDWGSKQVDRVLDLMDINYLISANQGYDPMYKAGFWNLSQNVDRNTMGGKPMGITPCLTPHMIPFLCYRGGPMTGIETLHMQGLPIDELILTRESSQQIQDLAGNAMSSTVVGTCMLAALILCEKRLPMPTDEDLMEIDDTEEDITKRISGDEDLLEQKLDLSTTKTPDVKSLLEEAKTSARLCICEGRTSITKNKLRVCTECEYTVCEKCGGRPPHVVSEDQDLSQYANRTSPLVFESKFKEVLPMRVKLNGIIKSDLESILNDNTSALNGVDTATQKTWARLVMRVVAGEFRFKDLLRQEQWTAIYEHPHARLELFLHPKKPVWKIFGICPETEGVKSLERRLCEFPLARMAIEKSDNILSGNWKLCLPTTFKFDISITGIGKKVPSWKRDLGIMDAATLESEVWDGIRFTVPDEMRSKIDRDISGDYKLLKDCGTAQGALHIKTGNDGLPPLYLFMDQTRIDVVDDCFVFSENRRRLGYGEARTLIAKLPPAWRQFSTDGDHKAKCTVQGTWVSVKAELEPLKTSKVGTFCAPGPKGLKFTVDVQACETATTLILCKVPLEGQAEKVWPIDRWFQVDSIHEKLTYQSLAWLTERIRSMKQLGNWFDLGLPAEITNCERCAPTPPQLKWELVKNKYIAFEDSQEAAPYERALKNRPACLVTHLHLDQHDVGTLRIGLNVPSLVHRALARLPTARREHPPTLSWRLVTDYIPDVTLRLKPFELTSNKKDPANTQPPNFVTKLRPEQLRSLHWMLEQESEDVVPFFEEEVEESVLPHLNWRAEGRAVRPNYVRGGVLADEVGYGKTAISIGLIDCTQMSINPPKTMPGAIPVKATIIVVPGHLSQQWPSEIRKFTGKKYALLEIKSMMHLNKITAQQIKNADIVLVAASLFQSDSYLLNFACFAGAIKAPSNEGRRFMDWQRNALDKLSEQVEVLRDEGAAEVKRRIDQANEDITNAESKNLHFGKGRKIGAAYVASKEASGEKRKRSTPESDEEVFESDSDGKTKKKVAGTGSKARLQGDPWGLKTNKCKIDPMAMSAPPLEMFHFNRLIVDEFTYLKGQVHAGITSLKSSSRWVLSGTPPLDDFADVKTISVFLDVHLGVDDEMGTMKRNEKKIRKDRTGVEQFTSFKEMHSYHWHQRRQEIAQAFLNQFVRQNYAEIDEIPSEEHLVPISLPAAERAIYLELEHYLQALDYNMQKSRAKVDNDRDRRQQEALGDSKTAEEALIKRCSHFDLDLSRSDEENAVQACDVIVEDRKRQLASCREDIRRSLADAAKRYAEIPRTSWENVKDLWSEFVNISRTQGVGDPAANHDIKVLLDEALSKGKKIEVVYVDGTIANPKISDPPGFVPKTSSKSSKKKEEEGPIEIPWPETTTEAIQQLKDKVFYIRTLVRKELTGRHRSLRYFTIVRDLQKFGLEHSTADNAKTEYPCLGDCGREHLPVSEVAVLSSCGHLGCFSCLDEAARKTTCLTPECEAATRALAVVRADSLGTEDKKDGIGRHHGRKLEKVMELIKERIPADEKVLLFVQFPDLLEKVAKVLTEYGVKFLQIKGSASKQGEIVQDFQNSMGKQGAKVLLLNVMQQSSSGANFTNANHAIMLSPLLTETDYEYKSSETQAIGRVLRYGQTKTVHIWRFLTEDTMDVETFEKRTKKKRADWGKQVHKI